jgi:hypothetical protein
MGVKIMGGEDMLGRKIKVRLILRLSEVTIK